MQPDFPVGPRAQITAALLALLAEQYALGAVHTASDLGGTYNLNIALRTRRGQFVARVYRPWVTPTRLQGIQHLKRQLAASGVPTVLPCHTTTGETLCRFEDRVVELEPFVDHEPGNSSWKQYQRSCTFLGHLHRALAQQTPSIELEMPRVENYATPATLSGWLQITRQRLTTPDDSRSQAALAICDTAEQHLETIGRWWEQTGQDLPQQLIHGDYGPGNVLFVGDRVVAVVDWDFVARHERVFDLAYTLFWMYERMEAGVAPWQRAWQRMREMVRCYEATAGQPLTAAEHDALPIEMARVPLYWVAEAAWLPDTHTAVIQRADQVALAAWLLRQVRPGWPGN